MKRFVFLAITAIAVMVAPFALKASNPNKILIAYFSWGGNTATVANHIAEQTMGDLFRIEPNVPYPTEYTPCTEVALEERDTNARPAISNQVEKWDDYDVIFIGCPVWWHEAPMIIHTFAESYDFKGKTVVPFCTYASTYRDETLAKIVEITSEANHLEGFGARSSSITGVDEWLERIGMIPTEEPATPQAVDLGLSVKWAPFNVGATAPEEYGILYGWADPTGNTLTENLNDYPSANPPVSICGSEYDIATVNWGKDWRMPTQAECAELATKCTWEWSAVNGVNGMTVTGSNGNSIFLPAAASRTGSEISNQAGKRGNYWSGTLWPDNSNFASYLYFYSDASRVQPARSNRRYVGMSVRPVSNDAGSGIVTAVSPDGCGVVEIFDIIGNRVYNGPEDRMNLTGHGFYIVKGNNLTRKIRL